MRTLNTILFHFESRWYRNGYRQARLGSAKKDMTVTAVFRLTVFNMSKEEKRMRADPLPGTLAVSIQDNKELNEISNFFKKMYLGKEDNFNCYLYV